MRKTILILMFTTGFVITANAQDIIILKNGDEIQAKVVEITDQQIKYKEFDFQSGPIRNINKSEASMIAYENGEKENFNYGNQLNFKSDYFTISEAYNITYTSAKFYCSVKENITKKDRGVKDKGICYSSQNSNPTIKYFKISKGRGVGNYKVVLTDLNENTTYYVRPYATTKGEVIYGNMKSFTTKTPKGVLINDVDWATCNVAAPGTFAATPEDAGMYYQWTRKTGWSITDPMINHEGSTTSDRSMPTGGSWEAANDPCPAGWRVPTKEELNSLKNADTERKELNNIKGYYFQNGGQEVFFPAAGIMSRRGTLKYVGISGYYLSSTPYGSIAAYYMVFTSSHVRTYLHGPKTGFSVRCVSE